MERKKLEMLGILISVIIPLILCIIYIIVLTEPPLILFPAEKDHFIAWIRFPARKNYFIDGDTDRNAGGKSIVNRLEIFDYYLSFRYTLKKGIEIPYAYLYINPGKNTPTLDLTSYDHLGIRISSSLSKSVQLVLKVLKPGTAGSTVGNTAGNTDPDSFLPLVSEVMTIKEMSLHKISLKKFTIPGKWLRPFTTEENMTQKEYLKSIVSFEIYASNVQPDVQDTITIELIAFYKNKTGAYIWLAVFFVLYLSGQAAVYVINKRISRNQ